jgi:hypothetical protein
MGTTIKTAEETTSTFTCEFVMILESNMISRLLKPEKKIAKANGYSRA